MLNQFCDDRLSFEYLDPDGEGLVISTLSHVKSHQGQIPKADTDNLNQILQILTAWKMPARAIMVLLAHHLLKHKVPFPQQQANFFGDEIRRMAQDFDALSQPPVKQDDAERLKRAYRTDRLRQLFIAAYTDLELALLCLATHVVRMKSIKLLSYRDARLLAEDNEVIFLPLMEMLGMWQLRRELGDLSLETLNPKRAWDKIRQQQELVRDDHRLYYEDIRATLESRLSSAGIEADIRLHVSPPSSIFRRMLRGEALEELARKVKIDILVKTEGDCHKIMTFIHQCWPPMPAKALVESYYEENFIAWPKFNGYRGLITNASYPKSDDLRGEIAVEFRIRTREMEETNAYGVVAARFLSKPPIVIKNAWWEDDEVIEFVRNHPVGSSTEEIYVFSPVGQVYKKLPQGSTPIDYAYRVHSEVGNHCKYIWINGRPALYETKLQNGDLVEVEADPAYPGPAEKWLSVVKTSIARESIRRGLGQHKAPPRRGRELIDKVLTRELKAYKLEEMPSEEVEKFLEKTARYFNYSDVAALYVDIANPISSASSRVPSPEEIVSRLIATKLAGHIVKADGNSVGIVEERIRFAQCYHNRKPCRVVPGVPIVGRIRNVGTPHEYLVVYRRDCPNAPRGDKAISLGWRGAGRPGEAVKVVVEAVDRARLLDDVLHCVYDLYDQGLYLHEVHAKVAEDLSARIEMKITRETHQSLLLLKERLNQLKKAGTIYRATIDTLSPVEKILLGRRDSLPNPYTPSPVRDARLFKGREAEIEEIAASLRGDSDLVVVYGASRIGKTSLLRYMHDHSLKQEFAPILVEMQGLISFCESTFWNTMASKLINEATIQSYVGHGGRRHLRSAFKGMRDDSFGGFREGLEKAKELVGGKKLLIMIDDFTTLDELWPQEETLRVIYQLKSLVEEHNGVALILCVHETFYKTASPERVAVWPLLRAGIARRLDHLDRHAAERLIREPLGEMVIYNDDAVEEMLNLTACHPYYLQSMLYELIGHVARERRRVVTSHDLLAVIPRLLQAGTHYFADLLRHTSDVMGTVVAALAHVSGHDNLGASPDEIQACLREHKFTIEQPVLMQSLEHLRDTGVIERCEERGGTLYHIRIPLFGHWLLENRPLRIIPSRQQERQP